jgi:hypothetical protein
MSQTTRRASALAVHLAAARAERDREAEGRRGALLEVERLRMEVVRLHARVEELEAAAAELAPAAARRGLASLIPVDAPAAREA